MDLHGIGAPVEVLIHGGFAECRRLGKENVLGAKVVVFVDEPRGHVGG